LAAFAHEASRRYDNDDEIDFESTVAFALAPVAAYRAAALRRSLRTVLPASVIGRLTGSLFA